MIDFLGIHKNAIFVMHVLKCVMVNRRSYMSAHVLLNLLNKLGKRDKMRGSEFNLFNNTRARMLDSIYPMA